MCAFSFTNAEENRMKYFLGVIKFWNIFGIFYCIQFYLHTVQKIL